jgi:glycosyltransferase involved in cell wall biosynthesis
MMPRSGSLPPGDPARPLVSVITPTWNRHDLLFGRCIPSVHGQSWTSVEHIIVSDGPDPELAYRLAPNGPDGARDRWFHALPAHDPEPHWGAAARRAGTALASAELITYCDDDDALRINHVAALAMALNGDKSAGFAVSRMLAHGGGHATVIGNGPLACGNVGSPMIMHRKSILDVATWDEPSWIEDWLLVARWLDAGISYVNVDQETCDVWPSRYRVVTG